MKAMEWIDVNDRLPDDYTYVLVCAKMKGTNEPCPISIAAHAKKWKLIGICYCDDCERAVYQDMIWDMDTEDITHWMALPEPPKCTT